MENGRGHGSHRRQADSEPVFCTPGSRLTGYGRGSAVARLNQSIRRPDESIRRSDESISDRPPRSSISGSSPAVLEPSTSVTPTVPTNSRYSDLPPVGLNIGSHSRPQNVPTLGPSRLIVKRPYVHGSYNGHGPQVPIQQPKAPTVPIDPSLIEAALKNPHIQELIVPVTRKEVIVPVTGKEVIVPVTGKEVIVPVTGKEVIVPVIGKEVIVPVTGNPLQTADTQELVKRMVTIKNEINRVSKDVPGLEALIKKTSQEIQSKSNLLNSLNGAKESIQTRLNGLKEQEDQIFKQLCKDQTVRPPEAPKPQNLVSRPTQSAASQSAPAQSAPAQSAPASSNSTPGTLSAGSATSSLLAGSSVTTVHLSAGSSALVERLPSPASSSGSDSSGPTTTTSNGRKNVPQSLLDKAVRAERKRTGESSSTDTSTGITSGVKTSTPIRIGKRRKENGTSDGQGGSVADPQAVLAAVIRPASAVRATSSGTTSVKEEPMRTEPSAAGSVQTTMIVPETASEAGSESPAETAPADNRSVAEPEAETVTNQADPLLIVPTAETSSANPLPIESTHETSIVPRTPDPAAAKSVAPAAAVPKSRSFPLKSTNVQDPVPFKVKSEPANHYPGEEELWPQVTDSRPSFTPRLPSPPEEDDDEGNGILSMLSK